MKIQTLSLSQFSKYLNVSAVKDDDIHIIYYGDEQEQLRKSDTVHVDFYMLTIKPLVHKGIIRKELWEDQSDSYIFINCPHEALSWDISEPSLGYTIMFTKKYMNKIAKSFNFIHYKSYDEALFLHKNEADIIWDLYQKLYCEFQKEHFSKEIILSYISLICTYTQTFYDRQFQSRSNIYDKVISDFKLQVAAYFENKNVSGLPSVAYFADQANLSANYFGDLIKRLTGISPLEHIQDFIVEQAKKKLLESSLSISEISYSLGFEYPNYFARLFRKKTGLSPKAYRVNK